LKPPWLLAWVWLGLVEAAESTCQRVRASATDAAWSRRLLTMPVAHLEEAGEPRANQLSPTRLRLQLLFLLRSVQTEPDALQSLQRHSKESPCSQQQKTQQELIVRRVVC
jgi:hypothetical protein